MSVPARRSSSLPHGPGAGTLLRALVLILVGLWIYSPSMHGSWLWDDSMCVYDNKIVLSATGYAKAWLRINSFGEHVAGTYEPLAIVAEWLQWRLFGAHTFGYHLVSVTLHIASALLVWRLFYRLGLKLPWLGGLLFLADPIMVESVAWISELKNTLSLPPLLLALLAWLDFEETREPEAYRRTILWYLLSLLVKPTGLALPIIVLAYAWWKRRAISLRDLKLAAPLFVLSVVGALFTLLPAHFVGTNAAAKAGATLLGSLATVGWTIFFLLGKALLPVRLLPDYPSLAVLHPSSRDLIPPLLLALLGGFGWATWNRARWFHAAAYGLGFFVLNLIPVLVWVQGRYLEMIWSMDHLIYLPMIGVIGWLVAWVAAAQEAEPRLRGILIVALAVLVLGFTLRSHRYSHAFAGSEALWTYALAREPGNWKVHDFLARAYEDQKRYMEALAQLQIAAALAPDESQPPRDMSQVYVALGDRARQLEALREAVRIDPGDLESVLDLAELQHQAGDLTGAQHLVDEALKVNPKFAPAYALLAALQLQRGETEPALASYAQAVDLAPDINEVHYNYGVALLQAGHVDEAVTQLEAAGDLDDAFAPTRANLGSALARSGRVAEAIEQFRAAIALDPNYVLPRRNLALALVQTGDLSGAIEQYEKLLELNPGDAQAREILEKLRSAAAPAK